MPQLTLYPPSAHLAFHGGSLIFSHEVEKAVHDIHAACRGLGTDEQLLTKALGSKSPETRNLIAIRYHQLHNKKLKSLVKGEASGSYGKLLRMIATPLQETEARLLLDATKGSGTNETLCIQILAGRTNEEMQILRNTFFNETGKDISVVMNSEIAGDFRKIVMAILQAPQRSYDPQIHHLQRAEMDAQELYKAGQGRLGTNEEKFIRVLVESPPQHLKLIDDVYYQKYHNSIAKAVEKEFSGYAKTCLLCIVQLTLDPFPTIAKMFEGAMKGFGTDELVLSTAIVRYQKYLPYVKAAYQQIYGKELHHRIEGETSGDYENLLLTILDAPQDPEYSGPCASQPSGSYQQPPQQYPPQQYPPHQYPPQQYPADQYPPQQFPPRQYPPQQYPPQQYPPHEYPPQQFPPQQYPPQQYPPQHYPPQQYPPQQYPPQQYPPQQYPPQQY
uniref:Annexin n=1 Tax=Albugo laibachii Nc14 TaxID=890382 RepID=F0WGW1_9STRA|nr:Annexin (Annexin) Family putative [Albugo laibachii Nc14]|eukprot:CCA20476.1 Annexin (Annexin) Family putative [Albugo laibachii Nc14]